MPRGRKSAGGPDRVGGAGEGSEPLLAPEGKPYTFEKALERLEEIVDRLEDGSLGLEESLARFEEGVTLTRFLERELARARKRVEELVEHAGGSLATRPWGGDAGGLEDEGSEADEAGDRDEEADDEVRDRDDAF